ncbi:MAG: HAD family hydrolase [Deltaproteobacteria bacterium]|nr:HAD family hydrolase [Deltaproteobacteria bacterium]
MPPRYARLGIRALAFDFDGTLAVPTLDFAVMRQRALEAVARHVPPPAGPELPTMELLALVGTATEAARAARAAALLAVREVEVEAAAQSALFPFVRPMILRLKALGLGLAVITRNCPEAVMTVFPDIRDHCLLLTRDDVPRIKPHPDHLLAALEKLNAPPGNSLMTGDHPMDVETGKRAGSLTGAVASGEYSLDGLAAAKPDFLAPDGETLLRELEILP